MFLESAECAIINASLAVAFQSDSSLTLSAGEKSFANEILAHCCYVGASHDTLSFIKLQACRCDVVATIFSIALVTIALLFLGCNFLFLILALICWCLIRRKAQFLLNVFLSLESWSGKKGLYHYNFDFLEKQILTIMNIYLELIFPLLSAFSMSVWYPPAYIRQKLC